MFIVHEIRTILDSKKEQTVLVIFVSLSLGELEKLCWPHFNIFLGSLGLNRVFWAKSRGITDFLRSPN